MPTYTAILLNQPVSHQCFRLSLLISKQLLSEQHNWIAAGLLFIDDKSGSYTRAL
jgi:hypothetical protein